jgi:hypothetical protein
MLATSLPELGWEVEVLTVSSRFYGEETVDPEGNRLRVDGIRVHEVELTWERAWRAFGVGSMGWRAFWVMYKAGLRLLEAGNFDVVYISTAQFAFFCLGRLWKERTGVPYILDLHDPWVKPPGAKVNTRHRWKHVVNMALAGPMERYAFGQAAGVVSVSPDYLEQLRTRLGRMLCLREGMARAIPFGVLQTDVELGRELATGSDRARTEWVLVYTGAGGAIMAAAFEMLCRVWAVVRAETGWNDITLRLYGTQGGWKEGEAKFLQEMAGRYGLGDVVREEPKRIGYVKTLELVAAADGLIVFGVDDPAYMPSKLFPYAWTGKPLLACLHRDSQAAEYFRGRADLGELLTFPLVDSGAEERVKQFFRKVRAGMREARSWILADHGARAMADKHVELFEACLRGGGE